MTPKSIHLRFIRRIFAQFSSHWKLMKPEVELLAIMVSVYLVMSLQLWVATWFGRWVAGNGWTCLVGWLEMFWEWRFVGFLNRGGGFKSKVSTSVWPDPADVCRCIFLNSSCFQVSNISSNQLIFNQLIFIHGKLGDSHSCSWCYERSPFTNLHFSLLDWDTPNAWTVERGNEDPNVQLMEEILHQLIA